MTTYQCPHCQSWEMTITDGVINEHFEPKRRSFATFAQTAGKARLPSDIETFVVQKRCSWSGAKVEG